MRLVPSVISRAAILPLLLLTLTACPAGVSTDIAAVRAAVASVAVTAPTTSPVVGQALQLVAVPRDATGNPIPDRPVTWASSANSVASVSSSGLVSAVAPGSATISATSDGTTGSVALSVATPVTVATVTVSAPRTTMPVGGSTQLTVTTRDASGAVITGHTITWSSSGPGIAAVNGSGLVSGVSVGSATITATSDGRSGSTTMTVAQVPVASVRISAPTTNLSVGAGTQFGAVVSDAAGNVLTGRTVTWSSSNPSAVAVSGSGYATAASAGSATITATSEGIAGSAVMTVTAPVATVTVTAPRTTLNEGETTQLTATPRDANGTVLTGRAISWSSSGPGVATVGSSGLVTAVSAGTANITATSEGQSAGVTITVTVPPPPTGSNEPSGLTPISDRHFQALNEAGWTDYKAGNFSLIPDATAPQYSGTVGQVLYPAGFAAGTEPVNLYAQLGGRSTLYLAFWFKMSPNFYGHPNSSVNKIFHIWIGGVNRVYVAAMGAGNITSFQPQVRLQQVPAQANYNLGPNLVPSTTLLRDRWYKWEIVLHANTPGVSDGTVEMWLNGVKIASHTGIQFIAPGQGNTWDTINWAPTWGGTGGSVPADQWMRMSEIYLSGR